MWSQARLVAAQAMLESLLPTWKKANVSKQQHNSSVGFSSLLIRVQLHWIEVHQQRRVLIVVLHPTKTCDIAQLNVMSIGSCSM